MNQPQLNPRDGANIPKKETLPPDQKRFMEEVEKMTKSESHALSVLAQAQAATLEAVEVCEQRLQTIVDLLVKAMVQFGVPLPAGLEADMKSGDYNPDELTITGDGPDSDEDDEEITSP